MPGNYCAAIGCKNTQREKKFTFHSFPVDPAIRSKWIEFVRRADWEPFKNPKNAVLCSEHFKKDDFNIPTVIPSWINNDGSGHKTGQTRLKKGAIPSVEISSNFCLPKRLAAKR